MSRASFFSDPDEAIICDASAVINIVATQRAGEILSFLPQAIVLTDVVYREIESGIYVGRKTFEELQLLVDESIVVVETLGAKGWGIFTELVSSAEGSLDDGEASTIGLANEVGGIALIDERRAISRCGAVLPNLKHLSTTDLLFDAEIRTFLGNEGLAEALFLALRDAKMRVSSAYHEEVARLVGRDRLTQCTSLPRRFRF